jgi:LacI family transcriptional regulator, repressor for deo operon, udp, cdd, tsx, nupC, and nupG
VPLRSTVRRDEKRATSLDVARRAGVSQATVSVVLNGSATPIRISDETRARVVAAAAALGYVPNHAAQSLRRRRTRSITFISPAPDNPYFAEVVAGAQAAAQEAGYSVFIAAVPNARAARQILLHLNAGHSDGVIFGSRDASVGYELRHAMYRGLMGVALHYAPWDDQQLVPVVRTDKEAGGYLATRHLIRLGHRRIAHLVAGDHYAHLPRERTAGYRRALAEAGIEFQPEWLLTGTNSVAGGDACMRALLERPGPPPSAAFVFNDQMAIGALHAVRKLGLRVPEDIAIVGFDGVGLGAFTNPELTSVEQPTAEIGRRAVEVIFDLLDGKYVTSRELTLPLRLVIRESCGASKGLKGGREHAP